VFARFHCPLWAQFSTFFGRFLKVDLRPQRALRGTRKRGLSGKHSYFYDSMFLPNRVFHRQSSGRESTACFDLQTQLSPHNLGGRFFMLTVGSIFMSTVGINFRQILDFCQFSVGSILICRWGGVIFADFSVQGAFPRPIRAKLAGHVPFMKA